MMKLSIPCMECLKELGHPTLEFEILELCDDGRYEICCSRGHKSVTILQQQKFEILFDIGANAILDGYYREAVSSFTSSLERFYEFCLKVLCEKRGIKKDIFSKVWKKVSSQSERQLGAFIFLWTSEFGEDCQLLSNSDVSFRNSVIHKGKIPTKGEAVNYGNKVLSLIRLHILQLRSTCEGQIDNIVSQYIQDCSRTDEGKISGGTMCVSTIISLAIIEEKHNNQTLEEALSGISKQRDIMASIEDMTTMRN
ncbi:hypothetical protein [Zymobacter sp. IVIA_5232.4 C2]|uniref:hypothetical protein n=1 Tax=Zymobacter sp. IVIA_5232.4 C2 TaxID=3394855 RepID=UPI0039C11B70